MAMSENPHVSMTGDGTSVTVVGGGELDITNSQDFHDWLARACETAVKLTVDLRDACFIDTAIVQDLAKAGVRMMNRGQRLKVMARETAYPLRVLRISGFESIMDIEVESG